MGGGDTPENLNESQANKRQKGGSWLSKAGDFVKDHWKSELEDAAMVGAAVVMPGVGEAADAAIEGAIEAADAGAEEGAEDEAVSKALDERPEG